MSQSESAVRFHSGADEVELTNSDSPSAGDEHPTLHRMPTPKLTRASQDSPYAVQDVSDDDNDDEKEAEAVTITLHPPPPAASPTAADAHSSARPSSAIVAPAPSHGIPIPILVMSRSVSDQTAVRKGVRFLPGSGGSTESDKDDDGAAKSPKPVDEPNAGGNEPTGNGNGTDGVQVSDESSQDQTASDDIEHRGIPESLHLVYRLLDPNDNEMTFRHVNAHPELWTDEMLAAVVKYIRPRDLTGIIAKGLRLSNSPLERNVTISCRNLSYTTDDGIPRLQGITAYLRPKMMMCILGGPDAGITTFLDVLAGRQKGGTVSGELLCDGLPFSKSMARSLGYVVKDDTNLPTLTVRETLMFSAGLRQPKQRLPLLNLRVEIVLKFIGMLHVADNIVGNNFIRGISGGERRRLSFACETMAGHASIIADLPTNGLDSASAYSCLHTIQMGCMAGRSVACSLVQPSPELFSLFSHVLVLSKGAQMYFGPATQVELYFGHHGFKRPAGKELPDFLEEISTTPGKFWVGAPPLPVEYLRRVAADPREVDRLVDIDSLQATASRLANSPAYSWCELSEEDAVALQCTRDNQVHGALMETSVKFNQASGHDTHGGNTNVRLSSFRKDAPPELHASPKPADARVHVAPVKKLRGLKRAQSFAVPEKEAFDVPFDQFEELIAEDDALSKASARAEVQGLEDEVHRNEVLRRKVTQRKWVWMVQCYRRSPIYEKIGMRMVSDMLQKGGEPIPYVSPEEREEEDAAQLQEEEADRTAAGIAPVVRTPPLSNVNTDFKFHSSIWTQIHLATARQWAITIRNSTFTKGAVLRNIIMGLLIGTLFFDIGTSYTDARTRFGLFYFTMSFTCFNVMQMIPQMMEQRSVYYHQVASGYFNGVAYYMAFFITSIPFAVVEIFIFLVFIYPLCGLRGGIGGQQFFYTWLMLFLTNMTTRAWVLFISSIAKNQTIAQALTPVTLVLLQIFSGFMVPHSSMPAGWAWFYYVTPFSYCIKGLVVNELFGLDFHCVGSVGTLPNPSDPRYTMPPPTGFGGRSTCTITNGHDVLALYDMDVSDSIQKWYMTLYMSIFFIAFNIFAVLALLYVDHSGGDSSELPIWSSDVRDKSMVLRRAGGKKLAGRTSSASRNSESGTGASVAVGGEQRINIKGLGSARQSSISAPEAYLTFDNLCYSVEVPRKKGAPVPKGEKKKVETRVLLNNCFGYATPRNMVALMGPSGAGKSTLLDVLAGKKTGGKITGDILINGKPRDVSFSRIAGYVEQSDSHDPFQTIREAIEFSAALRLDTEIFTAEQRARRVEDVIDVLGLRHMENHIIGTVETGGVSPELRKKTTIAVELVMAPSLLFLDEPTTGLDSAGALGVMHAVHRLAQNISVICTIHQPSAEIVSLFDSILLVKNGGEVAYFGPITQSPSDPNIKGMVEFFEDEQLFSEYIQHAHPPRFQIKKNRADFALETIRNMAADLSEVTGLPRTNPAEVFLTTPEAQRIKQQIKQGLMGRTGTGDAGTVDVKQFRVYTKAEATGWGTQFNQLLQRNLRSNYRNTAVWRARFIVPIVISLLLGTLYFQLGFTQFAAQNRISLLYLQIIFLCFSAAAFLPYVFAFRPVYFREKQSHMYSEIPFWAARFVADLPYVIIEVMLYSLILYWIAGLTAVDNGARWGLFILTLFGARLAGLAFCEALGRLVPDIAAATGLIAVLNTVFMLFTGFLIQKNSIPKGWSWMYYVSFFRYPMSFLAANELRDEKFYCSASELKYVPTSAAPPPPYTCQGDTDPNCLPVCSITAGTQLLDQFSMDYSNSGMATNLGIVFVFVVGFQLINILAIRFVNHVKR